jgi:hypothetical protein
VSAAALALLLACQPRGVGDADARAALALACASRPVVQREVIRNRAPTVAQQPPVVIPIYRQPALPVMPFGFGGDCSSGR